MITRVIYGGLTLDKLGRITCVTGPNAVGKSRLLGSIFNGLVAHHKNTSIPDAARLEGRQSGGREWIAGGGSNIIFANAAKVDSAFAVFRDHNGARVLAPVGPAAMINPSLDWRNSCELVGASVDMVLDKDGNASSTAKGAGQMAALQIVAAARAADLILFDDIDQHLGVGALRRLVPALRHQLGAQVICVTHNPVLVGLLDPDEIWVMERSGTGPQMRAGIARLTSHPKWDALVDDSSVWARGAFWERALVEPWVCDLPRAGEAAS